MCYCPTPTLHLNLALTGDGAFLLSLKKTHSVWFISVLNYGDTENVLINHLLLVIPMSYPCHYTNLCPHKPHKHAHTDTQTHTHTTARYQCVAVHVISFYMCEHAAILCLVFWQSASCSINSSDAERWNCSVVVLSRCFLISHLTCKITFFHQYMCHFPVYLSILKCLILSLILILCIVFV